MAKADRREPPAALGHGLGRDGASPLHVVGVQDVEEAGPDEVLGLVAQHRPERRRHELHPALEIRDADEVLGVLDDEPVQVLDPAQLHLLTRPLGDVDRDADAADDLPGIVPERGLGRVDLHAPTVLAKSLELALPALAGLHPPADLGAQGSELGRDDEVHHALTHRLTGRPPEDMLGVPVPRGDQAVRVGRDDGDAEVVKQPGVEAGAHVQWIPPRSESGETGPSAQESQRHTVGQPAG